MQYIQHLTLNDNPDYGLAIYERTVLASYPLHWHEYYELEYIVAGSGIMHVNGNAYPFKAGHLFFATPADLQKIEIDEPMEVFNVSFKREWIDEQVIHALNFGAGIADYPFPLEQMRREYTRKDTWSDVYLFNLLNGILIDMARQIEKDERKGFHAEVFSPIMRALRYIDVHFREEITLEEVAAQVGLSSSYFSAQFHKIIGQTFKSHLINVRLNYAANLLSGSDTKITEVCSLSGFKDFANFLRAFKKQYNISPSSYRTEHSVSRTPNDPSMIMHNLWDEESVINYQPRS